MGQTVNDKLGGTGPDGVLQTVSNYISGQSRNREIKDQAGVRSAVTWTSGVNEVTISVFQEAAGTAELRATLGVCFDAPSDIVADTWLVAGDSLTSDSQMFVIPVNESRTFYFSGDGITRLDAIRLYGSEELGVFVEAA